MTKNKKFKHNNKLKSFSLGRNKITGISANSGMRKNIIIGISLLLAFLIFPLMVSEDVEYSTGFSGTTGSLAWEFTPGDFVRSSPALGDVDGDGNMEVLIGSYDDKVHCIDGTTGVKEWEFTTGSYVLSSPALGDVDGDGNMEVLVGSMDHKVYCIDGTTGVKEWEFTTGNYVESSPALGDVDGDGNMEVLVGSHDNKVYCIDGATGVKEWEFTTGSYVISSPALGDVDGDGNMEVLVGSHDNKVHCLNGTTGAQIWVFTTGSYVLSSPALGDVDGDGNMEILFGSYDNKVYCIDGTTGVKEWEFTTGNYVESSPALGDVDGDGDMEVLVGSHDNKVYCIDGTTGVKEWEFTTGDVVTSSPALGDVDGDGNMEVLIGSYDNKVYCIDGATGVKEWEFTTGSYVLSSPALGDVDGDGNMEVLFGSYDKNVYCLIGNGDPWAIPGPWPCRGGSALHHSNANDTDGDNLPDVLEISLGLNENNIDTDDDGMPDGWEIGYGLNPTDDTDGILDADSDGLLNLELAAIVSKDNPVVITKFYDDAREIECDGVADGKNVFIAAVVEHIENAGVHSGDAIMAIPAPSLPFKLWEKIQNITRKIAIAMEIQGPFNIQFLVRKEKIYVIEMNLRSSRSMPFVSKTIGINLIKLAARAIMGKEIPIHLLKHSIPPYDCIKVPQFSFMRLEGADPILGVEMMSTGEVACIGEDFPDTLIKSMMAAEFSDPIEKGNILITVAGTDLKNKIIPIAKKIEKLGHKIFATHHTADIFMENGINVEILNKVSDFRIKPNIMDYILNRDLNLVINIPFASKNVENNQILEDEYLIRRKALEFNIPVITNLQLADALIEALEDLNERGINNLKTYYKKVVTRSLNEYNEMLRENYW